MKRNPLPNEHSARQTKPDKRRYKTYRRTINLRGKSLPKGISVIYGIKNKAGLRGGKTEIQSFRFDKKLWSEQKAKAWLKKNGFESKGFEKVRKSNPHYDITYIDLLISAILRGSPLMLTSAITYSIQNEICDDCNEEYTKCKCEDCEDCGYNRCLCDLEILPKGYPLSEIDRYKIRKESWKLAKETLSQKDLNILKLEILRILKVNNVKFSEDRKIEIQNIISL